MPTEYDVRGEIAFGQPQTSASRELVFDIDFSEYNLSNGDTLVFGNVPAGFIAENADTILTRASPVAENISIGYRNPPGHEAAFLNLGGLGGAHPRMLSEGMEVLIAEKLFPFKTPLIVTANGAVSHAKIKFILRGYQTDVRA